MVYNTLADFFYHSQRDRDLYLQWNSGYQEVNILHFQNLNITQKNKPQKPNNISAPSFEEYRQVFMLYKTQVHLIKNFLGNHVRTC